MPACVIGTGGGTDAGIIRLDFEGYSGQDSLSRISWEEWFRTFDERELALIVDDRGTAPNFNKLVRRTSAPESSRRHAPAAPSDQQDTVEVEEDEDDLDADDLEEQDEFEEGDEEFDDDEDPDGDEDQDESDEENR